MPLSYWTVPDGNNLTHIQSVVIQLGDEDGSHRLIERCAVHVDGGTHREDEAGDSLVDTVVLLGTSEGDGQSGRAGTHPSDSVCFITVALRSHSGFPAALTLNILLFFMLF